MYGITVPNTEPSINDSYSMLSSSSSLLYFEAYSSIYKFVRLKELLHLSIASFGPGGRTISVRWIVTKMCYVRTEKSTKVNKGTPDYAELFINQNQRFRISFCVLHWLAIGSHTKTSPIPTHAVFYRRNTSLWISNNFQRIYLKEMSRRRRSGRGDFRILEQLLTNSCLIQGFLGFNLLRLAAWGWFCGCYCDCSLSKY